MFSRRRFIVMAAFVAAIAAVIVLNLRGAGGGASASETIHLNDVAHASGIDFVHQSPTLDRKVAHIAAHIAALGACVSVADVNNDGWPDLYFTSSRFGAANALYINQKDGTFRDAATEAGIGTLNRAGEGVSMGAVWGDYDNDGFEDLLVYKWGYPQLFHNMGNGHFEDVTAQSGLRTWMNSNGAVWLDFDRDGLLDLYITGYFRSDIDFWHLTTTRIMQHSWDFASNGGKNLLFKNLGNGHLRRDRLAGRRQHALDARGRRRRLQRRRLARSLPRQRLRAGGAVPQPRREALRAGALRARGRLEERHGGRAGRCLQPR